MYYNKEKYIIILLHRPVGQEDFSIMVYNIDDMKKTSKQLQKILDKDLSKETLKEFKNVALALSWEGKAAEVFRKNVTMATFLSDSEGIKILKEIADFPEKCAEEMIRVNSEIARKIRETSLGKEVIQ